MARYRGETVVESANGLAVSVPELVETDALERAHHAICGWRRARLALGVKRKGFVSVRRSASAWMEAPAAGWARPTRSRVPARPYRRTAGPSYRAAGPRHFCRGARRRPVIRSGSARALRRPFASSFPSCATISCRSRGPWRTDRTSTQYRESCRSFGPSCAAGTRRRPRRPLSRPPVAGSTGLVGTTRLGSKNATVECGLPGGSGRRIACGSRELRKLG
jgi:hypothetical protein